jgi:hypothetical protein
VSGNKNAGLQSLIKTKQQQNKWFFSVGVGQTSNEIWLKSVQGFSHYVQAIWTDYTRDSSGPIVSQLENEYVGVCYW